VKKRCPFCEESQHVFTIKRSKLFGNRVWQVVCDGCGASGPKDTNKQYATEIFYTMRRGGGYEKDPKPEYIEPDYNFD
jgi:hypothetical protein